MTPVAAQPDNLSSQTIDKTPQTYFFCGIGGSGMSALARLMKSQGHIVCGSDRSYDQGKSIEKFEALIAEGFKLFPQDGSGLDEHTDYLVVSSAVEDKIPDVRAAKDQNIHIIKRAELLSDNFNAKHGIAIAGTSGKTTVTAMTGHIFASCGKDPVVVNGGLMRNFPDKDGVSQNTVTGTGDDFIAETDESDGSIALYNPYIAVLNNIALDHKPLDELRALFGEFVAKARHGCVLNVDNNDVAKLRDQCAGTVLTVGINNDHADIVASHLRPSDAGVIFSLSDTRTDDTYSVKLNVPGVHNVSNALCAIGAAILAGIDAGEACEAISSFKGTHRRLEIIGENNAGVTVIDDFAHNPDKIAASLSALKYNPGRLLIMYQPHGFKPTHMLREGLVESFVQGMGIDDVLYMPEIFYAGGTVNKIISSADIVKDILKGGRKAVFIDQRADIIPAIKREMRKGDRIVIMGARDDTLTDFCRAFI